MLTKLRIPVNEIQWRILISYTPSGKRYSFSGCFVSDRGIRGRWPMVDLTRVYGSVFLMDGYGNSGTVCINNSEGKLLVGASRVGPPALGLW